jgi:hypothetical protein
MRAANAVFVPLPYALLYRLPVVSSLRAVARYGIVMNFAVCGLTALGLDEVTRRQMRRRQAPRRAAVNAVLLCLSGLMIFEYWQQPWPSALLAVRPVDTWLSTQPRGTLVELPPERAVRRYNMFARIIHGQPTALGAAGSFPPPEHAERLAALQRLPDPMAVDELCSWGTRYVVIDPRGMKQDDLARWKAVADGLSVLRYDREVGGVLVYLADGCKRLT